MDKASWALLLSFLSVGWTVLWSLFTRPRPKLSFLLSRAHPVTVLDYTNSHNSGNALEFTCEVFNSGSEKELLIGHKIKRKGLWAELKIKETIVVPAIGKDITSFTILDKEEASVEDFCFETPTGKKWNLSKRDLNYLNTEMNKFRSQ